MGRWGNNGEIDLINKMSAMRMGPCFGLVCALAVAYMVAGDLMEDIDVLLDGIKPGGDLGESQGTADFSRKLKGVTNKAMHNAEVKEVQSKNNAQGLTKLTKNVHAPKMINLDPSIKSAGRKEVGVKQAKEKQTKQEQKQKEMEEKTAKAKARAAKIAEKAEKATVETEQKVLKAKEQKAKEKVTKAEKAAARKKEQEEKAVAKERADKKHAAMMKAKEKAVKDERPNEKRGAHQQIKDAKATIKNVKAKSKAAKKVSGSAAHGRGCQGGCRR